MSTHKEIVPNGVGGFEERDVPDGYHYELQYLNYTWQWVLVPDDEELIKELWNKG